uniref:G patch domain-containing protein 11 n=1 Tax=Lepeophtheirus salmonis TaxID=72036 RepID=D3PJC8_LEPSM|nr:Coiled-coil domain-containing protein 75 [Lepeophtheirus salmonis]
MSEMEKEEVDDYMSDNFVTEDVRPGLPMTYAKKRIHELKKTRTKIPKLSELESSVREDGLKKAIDSSNKGFAMLTKMGFQPGTALGKNAPDAIKEPISIKLRDPRKGLGREKHVAEKKVTSLKVVEDDFRQRIRDKSKNRFIESDIRKSQKAIYDLDSKADFKEPIESWYWPPKPEEKLLEDDESQEEEEEKDQVPEEEEEEEVIDTFERLATLTGYLRSEYFYCIWCADKYTDFEEMKQHCPGDTREVHEDDD